MSTLIHVGSSFRARTFLGPAVLSVCLLLGGALLMAAQADGAGIMLVTGATGLLATLLWGIAIHARRAKVEISPSGFRFHDRWGVREFFDEQVMCLGERVEQEYSQGEWKGTRRRWELCFHSDSGPLRVELVHPLPAGAVDPFRPLIDRLHEQLYQQGHDALAAGLPFEGEHWTLSPQELTVNRRGTEQSLRLEELSAAEVVDNRLCVWRCGGERPALEIPIEWANVATLGRLLKERVIADPIDGGRNDGNDLGR
ncbi:MAG: hypothetical protein ACKV0T_00775, partial [Planctomycetales bacterium]